jgi:hypothetical protein
VGIRDIPLPDFRPWRVLTNVSKLKNMPKELYLLLPAETVPLPF